MYDGRVAPTGTDSAINNIELTLNAVAFNALYIWMPTELLWNS